MIGEWVTATWELNPKLPGVTGDLHPLNPGATGELNPLLPGATAELISLWTAAAVCHSPAEPLTRLR